MTLKQIWKPLLLLLLLPLPSWGSSTGYTSNISHNDNIDFQSFKNGIQSKKINTVDEALKLIPSELFKNYVLVYRSRSLQESSFLYPRAIVFGRSARFILAFNGHPRQRGFNNLEIIQFDEAQQKWDFHEITFSESNSPRFEKNPKKCMECHQSPKRKNVDMRPNWEPYNFWPGVYASVDDTITPVLKEKLNHYLENGTKPYGILGRFKDEDMVLVDEQAQEMTKLEQFEKTIKSKPNSRYRFLGDFNTRDPLNFTKSLVSLNMYRVARLAKEELGLLFETYKYTLLGLGSLSNNSSKSIPFNCNKFYLPESIKEKFVNITLQSKYFKETKYSKEKGYTFWKVDLEAALEILFSPLGINTEDWSMDFKTQGRFAFANRFGSPADSNMHLREALNKVYPYDPAILLNCKQLESESAKAFTQLSDSGKLDQYLKSASDRVRESEKPLINRCMNCHTDFYDPTAPYIPFDNFELLATKLTSGKYRRGSLLEEIKYRTGTHATRREQMPPAGQITQEKRQELIKSLEELVAQ